MPKEKFSIIYADPPWRYEQKNRQGSAELHYPTMSIEEICSLPVADLAAKDSVLFLWATFPQLPEALKVIKAWGFSYRSVAFVWIKRNRRSYSWFYGLGYWTRGNAEICLLAVKGHPKRKSAGVHHTDINFFSDLLIIHRTVCIRLNKTCLLCFIIVMNNVFTKISIIRSFFTNSIPHF